MSEHQRDGHVVIESSIRLMRQGKSALSGLVCQCDGYHSRQNYKKGKKHLWYRCNDRRSPSGRHRFSSHCPLNDQKIRTPVSEREDKTKPHRQAEPLDAHWVGRSTAHVAPGFTPCTGAVAVGRRDSSQACLQSTPATDIDQTKNYKRSKTENYQEELKHFVVNR